jgi:hypothetical protein
MAPTFHYNAVGKVGRKLPSMERMSVVFVAAIRLVEWPEKDEELDGKDPKEWLSPPDPPSLEDIYRYVGVSPASLHGVGAMWDTIFLGRDLQTDSVSESTEISLIGRCLEKTLQSDLVPGCMEDDRTLALVANLFLHPSVNLKTML